GAQRGPVHPAADRASLVAAEEQSGGHREVTAGEVGQEVRISNRATYWPVAPIDLVVGAPILARLLIGAGPVGSVLQAVTLGLYAGSALRDWRDRQAIQRIDFRRKFGADVDHLVPMPRQAYVSQVD